MIKCVVWWIIELIRCFTVCVGKYDCVFKDAKCALR